MKRYYLTPKSPTSAVSVELGNTWTEAHQTLRELGYSPVRADQLLTGGEDGDASDADSSERWTVAVED